MKETYLTKLGIICPYNNILEIPSINGWNSNSPNFSKCKGKKVCLEIGSWSGNSANTISSQMDNDAVLFCCDTFLGSHEHFLDRTLPTDQRGRPILYEMFICNTQKNKDKIIPIQLTSNAFSVVCSTLGIKFDFIYIDGDHSAVAVYDDLNNYYKLLNDGGIIIGDDFSWGTVQEGLNRFSKEYNIFYTVEHQQFIIVK